MRSTSARSSPQGEPASNKRHGKPRKSTDVEEDQESMLAGKKRNGEGNRVVTTSELNTQLGSRSSPSTNGNETSSPRRGRLSKATSLDSDGHHAGSNLSSTPLNGHTFPGSLEEEDEESRAKRLMIPQILLYNGSIFNCPDEMLKQKHILPVLELFEQANLDVKQVFKDWTVRIKQRNAGKNIGHTDCEYFSRDQVFRSRVQIARHFKLVESDPTKPGPKSTSSIGGEPKKRKSNSKFEEAEDEMLPHIDDEFRLPDWTMDKSGQVPTKRRQKLLNEHLYEMKSLIDRLFRIDEFGHFRGEGTRRRSAGAVKPIDRLNPTTLRDIKSKVWYHDYVVMGRDATLKWDELILDVGKVVDTRLKELEAVSEFLEGVDVTDQTNSNPVFCAARIRETLRERGRKNEEILNTALTRIREEEDLGILDQPNTEPAMPKWRKELMQAYQYEQVQEYRPADGLLPEEKEQLLQKLADPSAKGNRWVYPEGLEMIDLWAQVVALDRSDLPPDRKPLPRLSDSLRAEDINEQHTWGIDCFCRRNIEVVLTRGKGEFRLTMPQVHFFIEMVLLRAINAIRPVENGWDVRLALRNIVETLSRKDLPAPPEARTQLPNGDDHPSPSESPSKDSESSSIPPAEDGVASSALVKRSKKRKDDLDGGALEVGPRRSAREKEKVVAAIVAQIKADNPNDADEEASVELGPGMIHRRVKIFWPDDDTWYMGRIIGFQAPAKFLVAYDDGQNMWEDLGKERFKIIGASVQKAIYDPSLSSDAIRLACEVMLEQYEKRGENQFQVHSKGIGVVTKVEIEPGKLVQKYTGMLYPCWLWEEKESKEDAERVDHKQKTGEVALPDFWNMRLELPKGEDEEGIDLIHVDAKTCGNFSSRMSHSCRPNCGTMTAVIDGKYCIGMRALRKIEAGEELTIDYNCVTDSMDEYKAAICLCGAHDCRGSFLYIAGATHQMQIVDRSHGALHRVAMLFSACYETGELERAFGKPCTRTWPRWIKPEERHALMMNLKQPSTKSGKKRLSSGSSSSKRTSPVNATQSVDKELATTSPVTKDYVEDEQEPTREDPIVRETLQERGFGNRALVSLPQWTLRFAAHVVEFIECEEFESARMEYSRKDPNAPTLSLDPDERWRIAKLESKGVADQRVTNLLIALDKARHHMCERLTTNTTNAVGVDAERSKLRERWWVQDRCLARWVGDDADEYLDWYPATVTHVYVKTQELRVVYDSHEVNRIPIPMARRPKKTEIPPPFTGCDVSFHQPPFRVLDEEEVLFFLWTDASSGVAARLVKSLVAACELEIPLWQIAHDPKTRTTYWWNFETKEIRTVKPNQEQLSLKTRFEPRVLSQIKRLVETDKPPTTGEAARRYLGLLRDLVLKIPVLGSNRHVEDMHQKAADLLTLYSFTRNFFVLNEPENETGNVHAVINALTSWIGQGVESRVPDVTEMVGTALLPPIERAYDSDCEMGYSGLRGTLISHIKHKGLADWPKNVVSMFPNASDLPPQPPDMEKQWPHPVPPVRLFGTPALDSAIYHHLDYTRSCYFVRENLPPDTEDRRPVALEEDRGMRNLQAVANMLREKKRDPAKFDADDLSKITPPVLPEPSRYTWVQCEKPDCGKWRKLPFGVDPKKLPSPFYCSQLAPDIDVEHADCSVAEEQEEGTVSWESKPQLDVDAIKPNDLIDAFDGAEWKIATVIEVTEDSVKIKYLEAIGNTETTTTKVEWMAKRPEVPPYAFPAMAVLHTYTPSSQLRKVKTQLVPYQSLDSDAHPDVARCLHQLVSKVERALSKERSGTGGRFLSRLAMLNYSSLGTSAHHHNSNSKRVRNVYEKLQDAGFTSDMSTSQRLGFNNFFVRERAKDPMIPFVTVLARWYQMDPPQREAWHDAKLAGSFAAIPRDETRFIAPPYLPAPKRETRELVRRFHPDHSTRTFYAELDQIVVGLPIETMYGKGVVVEVDEYRAWVRLIWGAAAYMPLSELKVQVPMFSACPPQPIAVIEEIPWGRSRKGRVVMFDDDFTPKRRRKSDLKSENKLAIVESDLIDHPMKRYKPLDPDWDAICEDIEDWRPRWMHWLLEDRNVTGGQDLTSSYLEVGDDAEHDPHGADDGHKEDDENIEQSHSGGNSGDEEEEENN